MGGSWSLGAKLRALMGASSLSGADVRAVSQQRQSLAQWHPVAQKGQ